MATLNTQTSVVDYLKSKGMDSSLASRTALGKQYGIDYSNTTDNYATQNKALLKALQGGGGSIAETAPKLTNSNDAFSLINSSQNNDFELASNTENPTVKNSYADLMQTFKETITGNTTRPEAPNFLDTYNKYRTDYGVSDLEKQLNDLKAQEQEIRDINQARKFNEEGKPVAMNVIEGRMSEIDKQDQIKLNNVLRQIENVSNQLNTKYSIIDTLMNYTKLDYQTAADKYDTQFSQNLSLFNTVKGIVDDQKSDKEREQDIARSNLQIIYNGFTSGAIDNASITPDMKTTITKLELQAGLPIGFYESLQNKNPKADILSTTTRESNGTKYADVILKNADGSLSTKSITLGKTDVSGSSNVSYSELLIQARAKVAPQLQAVRGTDGYVAPESYRKAKDAWVSTGLSAEDFDKTFKQYANPESYEVLGLSF